MVINGVAYEKSAAGCYAPGRTGAEIDNQTAADLEVFLDASCTRSSGSTIYAFSSGDVEAGGSIRIP
ncbi:hypothetical protein OG413_39385 [Streptomyces sp. NBC_01433]|uniref:hypothetical protein n=1 Tax=Streptomyces sp. NBC_01433 TaxID=2903864 RepID=UPI00224DC02E|nr:hypothetical protein [Streptomyces sp. NBC_01433]MCX4681264.1 hypothetical protein [Streptomyces sp. NBC_01433]